jgi:hypothetical protein
MKRVLVFCAAFFAAANIFAIGPVLYKVNPSATELRAIDENINTLRDINPREKTFFVFI